MLLRNKGEAQPLIVARLVLLQNAPQPLYLACELLQLLPRAQVVIFRRQLREKEKEKNERTNEKKEPEGEEKNEKENENENEKENEKENPLSLARE